MGAVGSRVFLAPSYTSRLCMITGWDGGCLCSSFQSSFSRIDLSDVKKYGQCSILMKKECLRRVNSWAFYLRVFSKSDVTLNVFLYY